MPYWDDYAVFRPPGAVHETEREPSGDWLYALDELSNALSVYRRDRRTGDLAYHKQVATLPANVEEASRIDVENFYGFFRRNTVSHE